uniref:Uncharacterized protein n=1 Tax=Oryza meridionalis TaxID=40149 RepID=A0A0E0DBG9_9ORYZ
MARTPKLNQVGTSSEGDASEDDKAKALARGLGFRQMPNLTEELLNGPLGQILSLSRWAWRF